MKKEHDQSAKPRDCFDLTLRPVQVIRSPQPELPRPAPR
jgi:hypothetical protein